MLFMQKINIFITSVKKLGKKKYFEFFTDFRKVGSIYNTKSNTKLFYRNYCVYLNRYFNEFLIRLDIPTLQCR